MNHEMEIVELGKAEDLIEFGAPVANLESAMIYTSQIYPSYAE